MAEHRRPRIGFSAAPRGTCRWCGEPIVHTAGEKRGQPDRRRRWHPRCVDAYNESDPREARRRVRRRDRGICARCGLDTAKLRRRIGRGRGATRRLRELGFAPRRSLWELDHVVPLIDGGGHELTNLQTLCRPCHQRKTAQEAVARRVSRHAAREDALERDLLDRADALLARSREILDTLAADQSVLSNPESETLPPGRAGERVP